MRMCCGYRKFPQFALTGVIAYYGILAAAVMAGVLLFLLFRFLKISLRQRNQLGMLMGTACSILFLLETAGYIVTNLGVSYIGVFCPFLSYGGTGTIVTYVLLGLLLSICRYTRTAPEREAAGTIFPFRTAVPAAKITDKKNGPLITSGPKKYQKGQPRYAVFSAADRIFYFPYSSHSVNGVLDDMEA